MATKILCCILLREKPPHSSSASGRRMALDEAKCHPIKRSNQCNRKPKKGLVAIVIVE